MFTLNASFPLRDQGVSNASAVDTLPRHRWYFVKEGFSPRLVEQAIATDGVDRGERLLDPFSGGGTVAVVAAQVGLPATAFELNPFLQFVSATKLRKAPRDTLTIGRDAVLKAFRKPAASPLEGLSTFSKGNRWGRWLFPLSVLRAFEAGRRAVAKTAADQQPFLHLALLGAAMDCCNATRDGKCLRYGKDWSRHQVTAARLRDRFGDRVATITQDLQDMPLTDSKARVVKGDARTLINGLKEKFRLCVTSPPYLNSFDYSDVYRPELFLGRFVDSNKALMRVRLKTIRSHVQASWPRPKETEFGVLYQNCIKEFTDRATALWDPRLPVMVQAYFEDMKAVLVALRRRAQEKASAWLVVSTSAYAGIEIPVDLILAEIGQQAGWFLREVGVLRYLRSSGQHMQQLDEEATKSVPLRESVVIFDAST
jgi:hypothetical protein